MPSGEVGVHSIRAGGFPAYVNLNRPNGAQFNPFQGATEEEAFELFQAGFSLMEKGDASDFYGIADRREAQATAKLMASKNLNIAQAYEARLDVLNDPKTGAEKFAGRLRELAETPSINAASDGIDLAKVVEEGGCIYVVGSMRNDIVKTVQRILFVRLIQLAERRDRIAGDLRPVCIVLDEVKYHLSRPAPRQGRASGTGSPEFGRFARLHERPESRCSGRCRGGKLLDQDLLQSPEPGHG